jgi:hypothetical protein
MLLRQDSAEKDRIRLRSGRRVYHGDTSGVVNDGSSTGRRGVDVVCGPSSVILELGKSSGMKDFFDLEPRRGWPNRERGEHNLATMGRHTTAGEWLTSRTTADNPRPRKSKRPLQSIDICSCYRWYWLSPEDASRRYEATAGDNNEYTTACSRRSLHDFVSVKANYSNQQAPCGRHWRGSVTLPEPFHVCCRWWWSPVVARRAAISNQQATRAAFCGEWRRAELQATAPTATAFTPTAPVLWSWTR